MDLDPDEIEIQLRSPREVGVRMIALSAVSHLISPASTEFEEQLDGDDGEGEGDGLEDIAGERFDWLSWMTQELLLDALSQAERALLDSPLPNEPPGEQDDAGASGEALGALAWSVRQSDLTVLDRGYPYLDLLDNIPSPWDDSDRFLSGLTLRSESEIATARESAEILSWRAQVEVERRQATGRDRSEIEAAIRDVAAEAASAGVALIGDDGDIEVGGESIRTLSETVIAGMVAAARARLRSMNWLCGLGEWDDPTLTDI